LRRNDRDGDHDGGFEQVDHLVVGKGGHGHLANLDQSGTLPQSGLPGEAVGLHLGDNSVRLHVESQLADAISAQSHFQGLAAQGDRPQAHDQLHQLVSLAVLTHVHCDALALMVVYSQTGNSIRVNIFGVRGKYLQQISPTVRKIITVKATILILVAKTKVDIEIFDGNSNSQD
jgi:hypothetical protein